MIEIFEIKNLSPDLLQRETARAMALIRGIIPAGEAHEVGSTAIPGMIGKQDIDILVRVPAAAFPAARQVLDSALARDPLQLSTSDYQGYRVESPLDVAVQLRLANGFCLAASSASWSAPTAVRMNRAAARTMRTWVAWSRASRNASSMSAFFVRNGTALPSRMALVAN